MDVNYTPKPGDIGLSSSTGLVGKFIRVGQAAIGDYSYVTHAFVVLNDGKIIEAMPQGAQIADLSKYIDHKGTIFSQWVLTDEQRVNICEQAIRLEGTPYSFLDYLSLAMTHWHIYPKWVRKRVSDSGHMICSQLASEAYLLAGIDLFPNNQLPMDTTPADLAKLFSETVGLSFPDRGHPLATAQ